MTLKETISDLEKYTKPGSSEDRTLAQKLMPVLEGLSAQELTAVGRAIQSYVKGKDPNQTFFRERYQYNSSDPDAYQLAACIAKEASNMQTEAVAMRLKKQAAER